MRLISISSRPRSAVSREQYELYERARYQQTCSACRRNGDPNCWLCAGTGYVTGNGSAHFGFGGGPTGGLRRSKVPHGGHDVAAVAHGAAIANRGAAIENGAAESRHLGSSMEPDFTYEDWKGAGLHVIHGATGNPVGRPRHDEVSLTPAARWKRKSRPLAEHREPSPVECNLPKECGGPCDLLEPHYHVWDWQERKHSVELGRHPIGASSPWDEWGGLTNPPNRGEFFPKLASPQLVAVGESFRALARVKFFSAVYAGYQAEIPREIFEFRKGENPRYAKLSAAFARLVDARSNWIREPMHAAIDQLEPQARRSPAARLNHEWLVQTLKWRGQPCMCGHIDVIDHLAAVAPRGSDGAGASPQYVAGVVAARARRAFELIGDRSRLVAEPPPPSAA